jgi:hypothetical protein
MLKTIALSLLLAAAATPALADAPAAGWESFGQPIAEGSASIPAATLLADPSAYVGKTVTIDADIADVCTKKGCWLVIADGDKSMRVLTKAHKFFVAMDSKGQTAKIQGTIQAKEIKADEIAHFESESSEGAVIPEKTVKGNQTFELIATGVMIQAAKK